MIELKARDNTRIYTLVARVTINARCSHLYRAANRHARDDFVVVISITRENNEKHNHNVE